MVSTILTHAKPACAVRSFAARTVQLLRIRVPDAHLNPVTHSIHIEGEKSGGVFA